MVLQHHEKMDGSGYPQGLSGEDILLEARILAVADVIEAMSSHRPYRPALGIEKASEELTENKGTLYDPDVVDAFLRLFNNKDFDFDLAWSEVPVDQKSNEIPSEHQTYARHQA
jgi:HD-GYP domain-containing protein (c-di-GMP phosphodiesterase class II)